MEDLEHIHEHNHENEDHNNDYMNIWRGQRLKEIPPKSLLLKVKDLVKTCFLPSQSSLQKWKALSPFQQCLVILQQLFPILKWGSKYNLYLFKSDLIAGLTIASLAIPQGISYAKLAGLPPIVGLYSSFVPPLVYAVMGTSKDIAVGTVAVVSILIRTFLLHEASNPTLHFQLTLTSTFFAGVFQASMGLFRLGFLVDFLSHATIVGFMAAVAIIVSLQQLKGLLGIHHFTDKTDVVSVMHSIITTTHEWNWHTSLLGISFIVVLLVARHISQRLKKLYWVYPLTPLCCVIFSTLIVFLTRLDKDGVEIIGKLKGGLNPPSAGMILLKGHYVLKAMKIGMVCGLFSLAEAMAIGRKFATLKGYNINENKEMVAIGFMNILGSCTSCYVTTGALIRSAINYNSGCKTAASNIIMATVVMITLLFLMPLFMYTPTCILSSILMMAVINLIDVNAIQTIWKVDKADFLALICAFLGALFLTPMVGLLLSVLVTMIRTLVHVMRPRATILGRISRGNIYRDAEQYIDIQIITGCLIIRIDAPIYCCNANYIRERVIKLASGEEEQAHQDDASQHQFVLLDLSGVTSIDINGIHMFEELLQSLNKIQIQMVLINPCISVLKKFEMFGFVNKLGPKWLFVAIGDAIERCTTLLEKNVVATTEV